MRINKYLGRIFGFGLLVLGFGILVSNVLATGDNHSPYWTDWRNTSDCSTNQCGSTSGTQNQSREYKEWKCDQSCPSVNFSDSREVLVTAEQGHYACKSGYTEGWWGWWHYCEKNSNHDKYSFDDKKEWVVDVQAVYNTETFGPIIVQYGTKSEDPNHCHKPAPSTLGVPSWAEPEYEALDQKKPFDLSNCGYKTTNTQTQEGVACTLETPYYGSCTPEGTCPTTCGLESSTVPDGHGGQKSCSATPACEDNRTRVCPDPDALNFDSDINTETEVEDRTVCEYRQPEPTPTSQPQPTATPNGDVCPNLDGIQTSLPDEYHFDNDHVNCLKFELGGPSESGGTGGTNVLGVSTVSGGQVLGASTMAKTGSAEENMMYIIFTVGTFLSSVGIIKSGQKKFQI